MRPGLLFTRVGRSWFWPWSPPAYTLLLFLLLLIGAAPTSEAAHLSTNVATGVMTVGTGAAGTTYDSAALGFDPTQGVSVVFLWWCGRSDTADAAGETDIKPGFGVAKSATERWAVTGQSDHGAGTTATDGRHSDAACVSTLAIDGTTDGEADFDSWQADAFRLIIDDAFPAAVRVSYLVWNNTDGGANAAMGKFTLPTTTGAFDAVTSLSFDPTFVLLGSTINPTAPPNTASENRLSLGAATATAQALLASRDRDAIGTSNTFGYCRSGQIFAKCATDANPDTLKVAFVSFTPSTGQGFRLDVLANDSAEAPYLHYVALRGGQFAIGSFLTATNTTQFTEATGLGQAPKGALFFSANRGEDTDVTANLEWSVGGAVSGSAQTAQYVRSKEGSGSADCFSSIQHDDCYVNASSAATQAIEGLGSVVSFDANGDMTLVMDDADPAQSFVWYVAFGDSAGVDITPGVGAQVLAGVGGVMDFGLLVPTEVNP